MGSGTANMNVVRSNNVAVSQSITTNDLNGTSAEELEALKGANGNVQDQLDLMRSSMDSIDRNVVNGIRVVTLDVPDNGGKPRYLLMCNVVELMYGTASDYQKWSFVGSIYSTSNTGLSEHVVQVNVGVTKSWQNNAEPDDQLLTLQTGNEQYIPCIVDITTDEGGGVSIAKKYIALCITGPARTIRLQGVFSNFSKFIGEWVLLDAEEVPKKGIDVPVKDDPTKVTSRRTEKFSFVSSGGSNGSIGDLNVVGVEVPITTVGVNYLLMYDITTWCTPLASGASIDATYERSFIGTIFSKQAGQSVKNNNIVQVVASVVGNVQDSFGADFDIDTAESDYIKFETGANAYKPCILKHTTDNKYFMALAVMQNQEGATSVPLRQIILQGIFTEFRDNWIGEWVPSPTSAEDIPEEVNTAVDTAGAYQIAFNQCTIMEMGSGGGGTAILSNKPSNIVGAMWYE